MLKSENFKLKTKVSEIKMEKMFCKKQTKRKRGQNIPNVMIHSLRSD